MIYLHQTESYQSLREVFWSSFCKTHIIQLEKWWSNIFDPSYKTLFIRYPEEPFSLKNALCLDEISDWFLFSVICTIADSLEKFDSNEKLNASQFSKFNFRFEVWIYLVWYVIQKTHDEFKANESVCIAKFEQQYVITIMKIFENEPKSWWLDEKMFYC